MSFFISSLFTILTSCEKVIDIDIPDNDRKIVINGFINPESLFSVNVSKSLNILDIREVKYLDNVTVNVYENDLFIEALNYISNGNYKSNTFYPMAGNNYKVEVLSPDLQTATASNTIPINNINEMVIDTLFTIYETQFEANTALECNISFDDPAEENYYWFNVTGQWAWYDWNPYTQEEIIYKSRGNMQFESNDPIIDSWVNESFDFVFSDELFNGKNIDFSVYLYEHQFYDIDTNMLHFNIHCITKDFYLYAVTHNAHMNAQDNPFTEPVQVYTNIENGYGIFAGHSVKTDSIAVLSRGGYYDDF
ncbi:DUF4249 domain-containing protein [Bacteroidota bacterium]